MRLILQATMLLSAAFAAGSACGHGRPITLTQIGNQLQVGGGISGAADGYAGEINVQSGGSSDPEDFNDFENFGESVYWTIPGLDINGLAIGSGLYLETIARPVANSTPSDSRVFWYWDPTSPLDSKVELAPGNSQLQIRRSASLNTLLTPTTTVAPPPLRFANPDATDMGFHNHDLLWYLMPSPLPADGAYAFFARFASDLYAPSAPFLVVINNGGLDDAQMLAAAADINRSAFLPGDFNHDDRVDAADYVVWRNSAGTLEDYEIWKGAFGALFPPLGSGSGTQSIGASVPEPLTLLSAVVWLAIAGGTLRRRTSVN